MSAIRSTVMRSVWACGFVSIMGGVALAGSHTWDVNEIFSSADGTVQFVELFEVNGGSGETGLPGHDLTSNSNIFAIPGPALVGSTSNKFFLIATQAFADLPGAPTPDRIIPGGLVPFFSISGDTISYDPWDSMTFGVGVLPTDGVTSLNFDLTTGTNSPTNYAGGTGSVDASGPPTCTGVNDCSGHGTCIAPDTCSCDQGWSGADCGTEVVVPTVSEWGLIVMALLIVVAGSALMLRRRSKMA